MGSDSGNGVEIVLKGSACLLQGWVQQPPPPAAVGFQGNSFASLSLNKPVLKVLLKEDAASAPRGATHGLTAFLFL